MSEKCKHKIYNDMCVKKSSSDDGVSFELKITIRRCLGCYKLLNDDDVKELYDEHYDKSGFITKEEIIEGIINPERQNATQ